MVNVSSTFHSLLIYVLVAVSFKKIRPSKPCDDHERHLNTQESDWHCTWGHFLPWPICMVMALINFYVIHNDDMIFPFIISGLCYWKICRALLLSSGNECCLYNIMKIHDGLKIWILFSRGKNNVLLGRVCLAHSENSSACSYSVIIISLYTKRW